MARRGIRMPSAVRTSVRVVDREELRHYFERGLSLKEIARLKGLDHSTIGKAAKRHGLVPCGQAKFTAKPIDPTMLASLVERGATLRELAEHFGVCVTTIRKHLAKHGLRTAFASGLSKRRLAQAGPGEQRELSCRRHGSTRFELDSQGHYRCLRCRAEAVIRRRRKVKRILVEEAGGACRLCGYDRSLAALHFHHIDPRTKRFGLSHGGFTRSIERLRAEASKCLLLCSNCHAEVEGGLARLPSPK